MLWTDFIVYGALLFFVLYITRINNMWGVSKGTKKAKIDIRVAKALAKKRKRTSQVFSFFRSVDKYVGFSLSPASAKEYEFKIERIELMIPPLSRKITPYELSGIFKVLQLAGVLISVILYIMTGKIFSFMFLVLLISPSLFNMYVVGAIQHEDDQIERDFPDLYLVLYSRLLKGTKNRLAPTLQEFLDSLDASNNLDIDTRAIKKFVLDFRNNIELYADDTIAIMKLREKYHSVMVVNFCNLAVQSMRGIDNKDKLLAFKIELASRRKEMMSERADKLVVKGSRAVMLVFLILAQFVVLSWYAKLTQAGGLQGIF